MICMEAHYNHSIMNFGKSSLRKNGFLYIKFLFYRKKFSVFYGLTWDFVYMPCIDFLNIKRRMSVIYNTQIAWSNNVTIPIQFQVSGLNAQHITRNK